MFKRSFVKHWIWGPICIYIPPKIPRMWGPLTINSINMSSGVVSLFADSEAAASKRSLFYPFLSIGVSSMLHKARRFDVRS